ncbi:HyaD/HybD family hydrogenase maturation endopeptidase [Anaerosinus massiliensis]|uniref:HyaD/HybD family hydrogenase maturation endopeptidase n=1 Tax=Massilibacillus massiliensis TaxID=1806837 RepID=UPI000AF79A06|nr:HyaD/HybD family hydrogenase maturation endopeptidase [Massilibacillus massiliensis]
MEKITVLGIGNIILQDEGFGVHVVEQLQQAYDFPEHVQVLDGGTLGMELMNFIIGTDKLIIVDAINGDSAPGTFFRFANEEVKAYFQEKVSMHELGIQDVLAALEVTEQPVGEVIVMGAEPFVVEAGVGLTKEMSGLVEQAKALVLKELKAWQIVPAFKTKQSVHTI